MKGKWIITSSLLMTILNQSMALNPIPGIYGGVIVGGSGQLGINAPFVGPLNDLLLNSNSDLGTQIQSLNARVDQLNNSLNYSILGLIGGQLGYRWNKYRAEAEVFYNSAPFSDLEISNGSRKLTISSNNTSTNYISGSTATLGIMLNLYYDLLPPDYYDSNFSPFVGIGAGYASVKNSMQFYLEGSKLQFWNLDTTQSAGAGQVMAGILYFLDDFSNFGLDVRFFSTTNITSNSLQQNSNSYNVQIFSVNLTFNGAFNFG